MRRSCHPFEIAASHLWAAYRGQCPGVDPEEFWRWRVAAIAESEGRSEEAVITDIEEARQRIADAEDSSLSWVDPTGVCQGCGHQVADLTNGDAWDYCVCPRVADMLGEDVPASLGPAIAEASARYGQECLFELSSPQGKRLIVCQGRPDTIRAFLEVWGPHRGLRDLCGNAALGVAQGRVE